MIIDIHTHISAMTAPRGFTSRKLLNSIAFRFMRWRLGMVGEDRATEDALVERLLTTMAEARTDAAVVLAFDAVYDESGQRSEERTHLYVSNDYVMELAGKHPRILFGASVHPYRPDAAKELERCIAAGCVLMKWLPLTQDFDPADPRCIPLYEILAHHGVPLLSHCGGEAALPRLRPITQDPGRLEEALRRGVKVIVAHCGSKGVGGDPDYVPTFVRLVRQYENCYGDTAALCLPNRWYAMYQLLEDPLVRTRLLHGSDWPIIAVPPLKRIGLAGMLRLWRERNWMRRDALVKQALGFDDAYWHRAEKIIRITESKRSELLRETAGAV